MKHLLLIRHAKSGWDNANLQDFDRPLSDRGKKDAILMENFLNKIEYKPHLILCSPARRTQQTYDILFGVSEIKSTLYLDDLYQKSIIYILYTAITKHLKINKKYL